MHTESISIFSRNSELLLWPGAEYLVFLITQCCPAGQRQKQAVIKGTLLVKKCRKTEW